MICTYSYSYWLMFTIGHPLLKIRKKKKSKERKCEKKEKSSLYLKRSQLNNYYLSVWDHLLWKAIQDMRSSFSFQQEMPSKKKFVCLYGFPQFSMSKIKIQTSFTRHFLMERIRSLYVRPVRLSISNATAYTGHYSPVYLLTLKSWILIGS